MSIFFIFILQESHTQSAITVMNGRYMKNEIIHVNLATSPASDVSLAQHKYQELTQSQRSQYEAIVTKNIYTL